MCIVPKFVKAGVEGNGAFRQGIELRVEMVQCLMKLIKFLEQVRILLSQSDTSLEIVLSDLMDACYVFRGAIDNHIVVIGFGRLLVLSEFFALLLNLFVTMHNVDVSAARTCQVKKAMGSVLVMMEWEVMVSIVVITGFGVRVLLVQTIRCVGVYHGCYGRAGAVTNPRNRKGLSTLVFEDRSINLLH